MTPYEWALKERGQHELPGGDRNNERIVWYHSFTSLKAHDDETPWCSSFMCAAAESCGLPSTKSAAAKSWEKYGDQGDGSVGDIAVLKRKGGYHVAFISRPYKKGDDLVFVIGGNQDDQVKSSYYLAENLIAIRRFKTA